ncbi:hypothetical protein [Halorubrum kocurii]|uniref:Uncharacterized protein n=1 Tax=Halorubrum kocurii JCM 14978 TaxID=1230456 RepID=M0NQA7_9EURY|nr:hypothetical protein [Halorubrum kocurii]EMA59384.1 hypothetical protein C468_14782 [Halorubrum kocurii JCM 14978]
MVSSDTRSVGDLERRVEAFDATTPEEMDADDRARLTDALVALADAYGGRGEFDAEAEMIARLDRLRRAGTDADDVDVHLAYALANATSVRGRDDVYETAIDPDRLEEYRERIEELYGRRPEAAVAAPLARATAETIHANGKADRRDRIGPLLDRLEGVYDEHPEPDVAASLLRAYAHAELYLDDDAADAEHDDAADVPLETDAAPDRVARAEELFGAHPDGEVAAGLAGVLAGRTNADAKRTDVEAIEGRIGRIEALADRYPAQEEPILRWLPVATANAARAGFEAADVGRVEHWASETVDHHERLSTPSSATWAAVATFFSARASFFDGDVEAGEAKLERLEALEERYDNPVFAHWLGRAMFDAARSYVETDHPERARAMVEDLSEFAVGHEDREEIEAGLEALRSHAPHLFDGVEGLDDAADGVRDAASGPTEPLDAPHAGSVDSAGAAVDESAAADAGIDADRPPERDATDADRSPERDATGADRSPERDATDAEADSDAPGCGSCGDDGCGSCGSEPDLKPPASGPVLAAAGAAVALVGLSVAYTLYRAQRALRNAIAGSDGSDGS